MMIQVTNQTTTESRVYFELATEKSAACISFNAELGMVNVCCLNAAHKAYKGMGRTFWSFEEAKAAYKSAEMKSMIEFVESQVVAA